MPIDQLTEIETANQCGLVRFTFMRRRNVVTDILRARSMTSTEFDEPGEWPYEPELF